MDGAASVAIVPGASPLTPGYEVYARFYDALEGERAGDGSFLRGLVAKNRPGARSVFELACGTGLVLAHFAPDHDVVGVDLSPAMLEHARTRLPGARLVEADMTTVELGETFDAVLCVYDSINHLLELEQWEATFDRARDHLADGGVFVVDMNTEEKLAALAASPNPHVRWFDGNLLVMNVRDDRGVYVWEVSVFERGEDGRFDLRSEEIREVAFPRERVEEALARRFGAVDVREREEGRRLYFVCSS